MELAAFAFALGGGPDFAVEAADELAGYGEAEAGAADGALEEAFFLVKALEYVF